MEWKEYATCTEACGPVKLILTLPTPACFVSFIYITIILNYTELQLIRYTQLCYTHTYLFL